MDKTYRDYIYGNYTAHLEQNGMYQDFEEEKRTWFRYFMKNYDPHLPKDKNSRILDVGCGRGQFLISCTTGGYTEVEGVDLSESNVDFCLANGLNAKRVDGLLYLKENPNTFDVIVCNDVIEHLTKDEAFEFLIAIKNALKDNGTFIVKVPNMANPYFGSSGLHVDFTHEIGFTEMSLRQVLEALYFKDIHVFGSDIYVTSIGVANVVAKLAAKINNLFFYLMCCLYGRSSIKIFEKNLISVAKK
jgi:cyclopropane fatty-acyl-phospholipid synthase-like methyltransferase